MRDERDERERRYGLAYDTDDEREQELELADRIAEHASVAPGDARCRELARRRLGHGSPYEHPHDREPHRFSPGDRVVHIGPDGPLAGRVVAALEHEGLAEVDWDGRDTTLVGIEDLDPEGA